MRFHFPADLLPWLPLIRRLTRRQIQARYRGSMLGLGWSVITPILTLAVYTFIFSVVFQSRWPGGNSSGVLTSALNIFAGLITFNLFSESANNAPTLVLSRPNFVTKIVFPLQTMAVINVNVAAFHAVIGLLILILFQLLTQHSLPLTLLYLPLVWLPFLMAVLALSWLLSAIGVFFRDLSQITTVVTSLLMFLSAVFYPLSALPAGYKILIYLNPLALVIEQTRRVMIDGRPPSMLYLLIAGTLAFVFCELSLRFFQRVRGNFADVL